MIIGQAQMMLWCAFDGNITMHNMEIDGRTYHKNCSCELHKLKHGFFCAFSQKRMI
uniref:Uncharacterized protein n=1 Tax=Cajanus cajan TaxID=3821 RepID=A0A151QM01_CAJCA|nr:hypothetical protein KK1_048450 [Cajanus cajan]